MPIVDAMVTGRMTPIILLAARLLRGQGSVGRRNALRALDGNSFMYGANPYLSISTKADTTVKVLEKTYQSHKPQIETEICDTAHILWTNCGLVAFRSSVCGA